MGIIFMLEVLLKIPFRCVAASNNRNHPITTTNEAP